MKKLRTPWATIAIMIVCIIIQILASFSGFSSETEAAIFLGAYYKAFICAGEWWRLLSCGLIHISVIHLFVNSISLMNLGMLYENRFGVLRYLIVLFGSVAGGSAFMFACSGNTVAVGLSGGLYGLMGGYIVMVIVNGMIKRPEVISMLVRIVLINLIISFMPGVALSAHLGGLLSGMILTSLFLKEDQLLQKRMALCGIVFVIVLGWFVHQADYIKEGERYLLTDYRILSKEKEIGFSAHAYHMAENLDNIYGTDGLLTTMLEVGYNDSETE